MDTHQVLLIVVDTWILGCVTDSLQKGRFASIGPSDYKYTKVSILRSEVIGITIAHHVVQVVGCHWVKVRRLRGNNITSLILSSLMHSSKFIPLPTTFISATQTSVTFSMIIDVGWLAAVTVAHWQHIPFSKLIIIGANISVAISPTNDSESWAWKKHRPTEWIDGYKDRSPN